MNGNNSGGVLITLRTMINAIKKTVGLYAASLLIPVFLLLFSWFPLLSIIVSLSLKVS